MGHGFRLLSDNGDNSDCSITGGVEYPIKRGREKNWNTARPATPSKVRRVFSEYYMSPDGNFGSIDLQTGFSGVRNAKNELKGEENKEEEKIQSD